MKKSIFFNFTNILSALLIFVLFASINSLVADESSSNSTNVNSKLDKKYPSTETKQRGTPTDGEIPHYSVHKEQMKELEKQPRIITEDMLEAWKLEAEGKLFPYREKKILPEAKVPLISNDFIVFGYLQSEDQVFHTRWQALTHVGSRFVYFNSSGALTSTTNFTGRDDYLKAGGAAEAAGVKVILVVCSFDDNPGGAIETVMTNPSLRTVLINNIVNLVSLDSYCQGVSMDLEFSWGATVRDGVTAFMSGLRTALDEVNPNYELSIYTNAIFSSTQWNFDAVNGITPHINYMLYSMYDWASGNTPHAISDFNNCLAYSNRIQGYLNDGLPPEKLVLTISAYSRRWNSTGYDVLGSFSNSQGFTDAKYDTTLNTNYGGPYFNNYVLGDECGYYIYNDGTNRTVTWDDTESMEYKIRHALSLQDPNGVWNGRRIRGVGFWSLMWLAETSSYDPRTGSPTDPPRTRTYPHVYQLCQEILATPGTTRFLIEGFEGLDQRWRDPNYSPDTVGDTDGDCARNLITSPGGAGAPASTNNAMQVIFDFESLGSNKTLFGYEVLASNLAPSVTDTQSASAHFDSTTALSAYMYTSASYSTYNVRMIIMDADNELEVSNPYTLNATGWRQIVWDLTDTNQINAYTTSEPAFNNGDGILDTAGGGARDIAFIGFLIEGTGAINNGSVIFDEIAYEHRNPDGKNYVINEFRYNGVANEFVEIYGHTGAIPTGFQLRVFDSSDGSATTFNISGTITDDGGGYGFFVVGDPEVPYVDFTPTGFSASDDNIPDTDPSAIQLYNTDIGGVYDSVVYEAYGGLDDLIRKQTLGVTQNGYPWLGEIASGTNASGELYTMGRYPDGNNTHINFNDFSFMPASSGAANGNSVTISTTYNFTSAPPKAFKTFQTFSVEASGVGPSPDGGNVHRCVDLSGGGVITVIGDAALGSEGNGYYVSGEIYIPSLAEPAQAIGIGICGRQGSRFFTNAGTSADQSGYESGYWLIFENKSGVVLNDGRSDHPDIFEFVYATNDNMDGQKVSFLGSATRAATEASAGFWTTFDLKINPVAVPGNRLIAKINNYTIYQGDIPTGGPISGAFQVGFRENHSGAPASNEGTWIDNIQIGSATAVNNWLLY